MRLGRTLKPTREGGQPLASRSIIRREPPPPMHVPIITHGLIDRDGLPIPGMPPGSGAIAGDAWPALCSQPTPTTGALDGPPGEAPRKGASPKLNTPPSFATSQYPLPPGVGDMPTMGMASGLPPIEP